MKYLKLFENIDFKKISDEIDSLDIEKQIEIIKKLKRFTFDKVKDVNKRKRDINNEKIYNRISNIYDNAINISKNTYLKELKFNLDNFKISKKYEKKINKRSLSIIEKDLKIEKTIIDQIRFTFEKNNIKINLYIYQYINNENKIIYKSQSYIGYFENSINYINTNFFKKYGGYKDYYDYSKKELNDRLKEYEIDLNDLFFEIESNNYNL
jgi:hypothetical protein